MSPHRSSTAPSGAAPQPPIPALPPGLDHVELVPYPATTETASTDPATTDERDPSARRPRLLLVAADAAPPTAWADDEDWVRLPADHDEVAARAASLLARVGSPSDDPAMPVLDADGLLRLGDRWIDVPVIEARLLACLLHRRGRLVSRAELQRRGWGDSPPAERTLDSKLRHLRRRVAPFGLRLDAVRGRGYVLSLETDADASVESDTADPIDRDR
jgi:DNA-binding winged helix-turn-helix (wHTH) protein